MCVASWAAGTGVPQLPMLLFISDGSGGTGFDEETCCKIPIEYISQVHIKSLPKQ